MTQTFTPSQEAVDSAVGDEIVILHLGNSTYYGLDPIGTHIWGMFKTGQQPPEIRDVIAAKYKVSADIVEGDMRTLLTDLLAHDILIPTQD